FTYEFENGRDDISVLVMDEYFTSQEPPDVTDEYEVVGGKALSPTSPMQPTYSKRSLPGTHGVPIRQSALSPRVSGASASSRGNSLESKRKGKSIDRSMALSATEADDLGFSDDNVFDLHDYVDMDSGSDVLSEDGSDHEWVSKPAAGHRDLKLQSRFAGNDSVVLEPDFPASKYISKRPKAESTPRAEFAGLLSEAGGSPVKVTVREETHEMFIDDSRQDNSGGGFEIIDDYFKEPVPGEASAEGSESDVDGVSPILSLVVDVARAEVNLYSGQDWYMSEPLSGAAQMADIGFNPAYMDSLDDTRSTASGGIARGQTSASMPEYHSSQLGLPMSPRRPQAERVARRSAKPKVELRAVHVHSEYRQYAEASATAFDLGVNVNMLEILDELETSEWS
ncbi:hypothetical protein GGH18_005309, partial [Coemansia sp. RSA 530]